MAEFRRQKSDVAEALDKLQGFAENLMMAEKDLVLQLHKLQL